MSALIRKYKQQVSWSQWRTSLVRKYHQWFNWRLLRVSLIAGSRKLRRLLLALTVLVILSPMLWFPENMGASSVNVLQNGGLEGGFARQPGCGDVGQGWQCFTNGGGANYGFYDDQWGSTVAEGSHSQLIEINTKGVSALDTDRYAGIYQTVRVVDWAQYTLSLRGLIRTTVMEGDPWRYRVQVGWTNGHYADWTRVTNWVDVGWDTYYARTSPGGFSSYSNSFKAEADSVTVYVRVWKKWGVGEEELDVNFDAIALTGPSPYMQHEGHYGTGGPVHQPYVAPVQPGAPVQPAAPAQSLVPVIVYGQPAPVSGGSCTGQELIYNGGFEQGFNRVAVGHVGKSWGFFTNDGAANYGFYDDQWQPALAEGGHSQLIEINSKGVYPTDANRYAGIYQRIGWLQPGKSYELTLKGILRGAGNEDDPYRFEAQWGYNVGADVDWSRVGNWKAIDFGDIQSRTSPTGVRSYTVRFTAPAADIVLFIRGWKKWAISEVEMDLNLDAISLRTCDAPTIPVHPPKPEHPAPQPGNYACTYVVRPGDILGWIAERYAVSIYDLMAVNNISDANLIYVGQELQIPGCAGAPAPQPPTPCCANTPAPCCANAPAPVADTPRIHVVAPGETLGYICDLYGVDINTLAAANNIANVNFIYVGQQLSIP